MRVVVLAAVLLMLAAFGFTGGHYFPEKASIFVGLSNILGSAAAGAYFRSRKATRR